MSANNPSPKKNYKNYKNYNNDKIIKARHNARKFAIQAIYQWQINNSVYSEIEVQFKTSNSYIKHVDWSLFELLVKGVIANREDLDNLFIEFLPGNINQVNQVEKSILRVGCFELQNCLETPYKVIISEYVGLASDFGAEQGEKFVNGVIDKVAKVVRS